MTSLTMTTDPNLSPSGTIPAGARLAAWLRRAMANLARSIRRRRMRDALVGLDDRMLKDIGVKRTEIDYLSAMLASHPARRRPYY